MSSISTAIQLTDRMTMPLRNITNALNMTISAMEKAERTGGNLGNVNLSGVREQISSATLSVNELESELSEAKTAQDSFNSSAAKVDGLVAPVKRLIGAYVGFRAIQGLVGESDELVSTRARLNNMNDGLQTTQDLFNMIVESANNARADIGNFSAVVAKFGNNAKDAFSSNSEVVAFSERVQKAMTVSGASATESANAMLQLSQALGSGVLRGDELRSIFEQAPLLIRYIADYMGVPIGKIREMAAEGLITADIVKNAIMSDETMNDLEEKFDNMPKTWGQTWILLKNNALVQMQPVLNKINELANNEQFVNGMNLVGVGFANAANIMLDVLNAVSGAIAFASENWETLAPFVWAVVGALAAYETVAIVTNALTFISGVQSSFAAGAKALEEAATIKAAIAQAGLNSVLLACPITWIVLGVLALVAVLVAVCNWIAKTTGVAQSGIGIIVGVLAVGGAFIANLLFSIVNFFVDEGIALYNLIADFANFFGNVFDDPCRAIANLFISVFDFIIGVVKGAAGVIDTVLGTDLSGSLQGFSDRVRNDIESEFGKNTEFVHKLNASDYHIQRIEYGGAFKAGAALGDALHSKISGLFGGSGKESEITDPNNYKYNAAAQTATNTGKTAANTAKTAESLEVASENLKYIRDYAAQKSITRYTNTNIKVDMTNNNNIGSNQDIDNIATQLKNAIQEEMLASAEGVI